MTPSPTSAAFRSPPFERVSAAAVVRSLPDRRAWRDRFRAVRAETERRAAALSAEDQVVQSMPDASPTKWHRAHTTWFFEQFLLAAHARGYRVFNEGFAFLFNSYYVAAGPRHARPLRGLLTRPSCEEVAAYRRHVNAAVENLLADASSFELSDICRILEIGLHHEQQHQELLLTDILHAFADNPIAPSYDRSWQGLSGHGSPPEFVELPAGIHTIGCAAEAFCFDNERPAHQVFLQPVRVARSLVTNAQWLEFMRDGGYATASLWLSDGWATVEAENWNAPGYWRELDGRWVAMSLGGLRPIEPSAPVSHVSYFEADAFARWAGKHLPSEAEWELAARLGLLGDAFGQVWQWTRSAYLPYPGYVAANGALGEYNGKFMINQMVLRGSSHATPELHSRVSYRNFFYPQARWQFSGLRLVEYGECAQSRADVREAGNGRA